ncbi:hypothetical protein Pan181_19490 [Aeoliella mucimassa]|uniref:Uncharacterized protein n=2 Tax=Aeoliella mucimassa TaxID=2527972 RepID=A0A518ALZ9_9BACT|nr:hypothetical protein Pan181_19490 [Aeoliella mucimassa]
MAEESPAKPTFMNTFFWPAFVVVLLLGHMSLMLVAMTLANADPPELVEGSPYSNAPQAKTASAEQP